MYCSIDVISNTFSDLLTVNGSLKIDYMGTEKLLAYQINTKAISHV